MGITFIEDQMDTTPDGSVPESAKKTTKNPSQPNLTKVLEQSPFGLTALWIHELRRRLNMTQAQLATAIGAQGSQLAAWERGESQPVNPKHIEAFARAGQSRNMPPMPEPRRASYGQHSGPRLDPNTERLFAEYFGS